MKAIAREAINQLGNELYNSPDVIDHALNVVYSCAHLLRNFMHAGGNSSLFAKCVKQIVGRTSARRVTSSNMLSHTHTQLV